LGGEKVNIVKKWMKKPWRIRAKALSCLSVVPAVDPVMYLREIDGTISAGDAHRDAVIEGIADGDLISLKIIYRYTHVIGIYDPVFPAACLKVFA
jgi:hypothetical protein